MIVDRVYKMPQKIKRPLDFYMDKTNHGKVANKSRAETLAYWPCLQRKKATSENTFHTVLGYGMTLTVLYIYTVD